MREIIDRLEKGEGCDDDLTVAICDALDLGPKEFLGSKVVSFSWKNGAINTEAALHLSALHMPTFLTSLDAAIALVEKMLPGWGWTVYSATPRMKARAVLVQPEFRQQVGEHGNDPCRALLIALLRVAASTGLFASLTNEQQAAALAYDGPVFSGNRNLPRVNDSRALEQKS